MGRSSNPACFTYYVIGGKRNPKSHQFLRPSCKRRESACACMLHVWPVLSEHEGLVPVLGVESVVCT